MRRTVPILAGLSILAVVLNHANWHILSTYAAGDAGGYLYVFGDQIAKFAVAAFIFISGYFIAYATGGGRHELRWKIVRTRLLNLLWPWLAWSVIWFTGQAILGRALTFSEFFSTLFVQYYFVPLLMFYYLLAPWIAKRASANLTALLVTTAVIQIAGIALFYMRVYAAWFPDALNTWVSVGPIQYLRFIFFFSLGLAGGMFSKQIKDQLVRVKPALPWFLLGAYLLSVAEAMYAYHLGGDAWPVGANDTKITSALFSTILFFTFLSRDRISIPLEKQVKRLSSHTYGFYLSHYVVLGIIGKVIEKILPGMLSIGWLYIPIVVMLTLVVCWYLMERVARLPTKRIYTYLFG